MPIILLEPHRHGNCMINPEMTDDDAPISDKVQPASAGVGALYHRTYEIKFSAPGRTPESIMADLQADVNKPSAQVLATFEKVEGAPDQLRVGDGYLIHITGPWNGPVRVSRVSPVDFTLQTLEGHMEAGEINFAVARGAAPDTFIFKIESTARSRDRLVDFVYDKIPIARVAQTEMWDQYCRAVADLHRAPADQTESSEVRVTTRRRADPDADWELIE